MGLREKAVRGIAWSAVRNWGSRAVNFVVFLVLAWLLAPENFGLVALASVYIALIEVFVDQGFADALIQREGLTPAHLDTAFWTSLALALLFVAGTALSAGPVARLVGRFDQALAYGAESTASLEALGPVIRWLSLAFVLTALIGVQEALFERNLDYRVLAVRSIVAMVVGGSVGVIMAFMGYGVWSLVGYQLSERAAAAVVLWAASDWRPRLRWHTARFRELFSFGINIVGANLLGFLNRRSDNLFIGVVLGPTALGYYVVAYRLFNVATQLITSTVSSVAFATFSRLQGDRPRMRQGFYTATGTVSLVAFPLFIGGAIMAPELIAVLFQPKWLPSAPVFQVLAFVGLLHAVFYFNDAVMRAMGRPGWILALSALYAVCNVAAFALVVRYGIVAVAVAYVVRAYVLAPLPLWAVRRLIDIRWRAYLRPFRTPLIGTLLMAGAVLGTKMGLEGQAPTAVELSVGILVGALVYGLAVWRLEPKRLARLRGLVKELSSSPSAS